MSLPEPWLFSVDPALGLLLPAIGPAKALAPCPLPSLFIPTPPPFKGFGEPIPEVSIEALIVALSGGRGRECNIFGEGVGVTPGDRGRFSTRVLLDRGEGTG